MTRCDAPAPTSNQLHSLSQDTQNHQQKLMKTLAQASG